MRAEGEASSRALVALLRDGGANPPESRPDAELEILSAITRAYDSSSAPAGVHPGGTPLSAPGFSHAREVEGPTPQIHGQPSKRGNKREAADAGCEEECAVADGASERVLGRGAGGTEVRRGPRGERIERLPEFTLEDLRRARLDATNRWRAARGLEPKPVWWEPSEGGPPPAKPSPEAKKTPAKVVRRRKLADGTFELVEVAREKKK